MVLPTTEAIKEHLENSSRTGVLWTCFCSFNYFIRFQWLAPASMLSMFSAGGQFLSDLWLPIAKNGARLGEGSLFLFDTQIRSQWWQKEETPAVQVSIQKFLPIARCVFLLQMHSVEMMVHEGVIKTMPTPEANLIKQWLVPWWKKDSPFHEISGKGEETRAKGKG